jgi:hypothetical protein
VALLIRTLCMRVVDPWHRHLIIIHEMELWRKWWDMNCHGRSLVAR